MNATGQADVARAHRSWFRLGRECQALVAIAVLSGCTSTPRTTATVPSVHPATASLAPSSHLIVGRILAVDAARAFAIVEITSDAPAVALSDSVELIARTLDLRPTGRLRASRYLRGRTLGTTIVSGQPSPGDEVVWLAP